MEQILPRQNESLICQKGGDMIGPRKVDKPLSLYGYGLLGHLAEEIFDELKIPIDFIFDANRRDCPRPKDVLSVDKNDSLLAICVATEPYQQVIAPLVAAGWRDIVPVWDIIEAYPEMGLHNGWFAGTFLEEECRECGRILDGFGDNTSRRHYMQHLDWRQYRREQPLFQIESIGGALPSTLAAIRRRQNADYYSQNAGWTGPEVDIHAEGRELDVIKCNISKYQRHRPCLKVACYHSSDGLWKIPKLLMDSLPNYRFTFRLHAYMGQGAYMYGTPNERGKE